MKCANFIVLTLTAVVTPFSLSWAYAAPPHCEALDRAVKQAVVKLEVPWEQIQIKPAELPNLRKVLVEMPVESSSDIEQLKSQIAEATNFTQLGELTVKSLDSQCIMSRLRANQILIWSIQRNKLSADEAKKNAEVVRAQWLSEMSAYPLNIVMGASLANVVCEKKLQDIFGMTCAGLEKFKDKAREDRRQHSLKFKDSLKFSFTGRLAYYWDTLIKGEKVNEDNLTTEQSDRYYDVAPVKKYFLEDFEVGKTLRSEFQKFFI